ncbi:TonB-dependent receptor domain-containing protein [Flavilitoribacter nigricans]|uniref:TonB-dependent receptor n=1 Tax=Flavilitoribacter nigricans (strain ATCC 23147 / DSM 23189 / NBRC 102662 / NCIMB 1420 / SS-2) TaxID=1122177 RepID=A0A2D0NIT5_FLAN2|nr:TonB-dependent receptor [Flavilitoribacter nigricans]PHN08357.1 TonB-dependent receptor [Flavilitoribacter nigricans DSM 23189 = NBRC 102662]
MKKLLLSLSLLFTLVFSYAQFPGQSSGTSLRTKGIARIAGTVLDSEGGSGVEFATISLFLTDKNELIDGTITDDKGKFSLNDLIDGNYYIEISYLGFEKKVLENIVIEKERNVDLEAVALSQGANVLDEVTVTSDRSLIEEKVDRMVYNAEKDNLAKGGDAADVLRKVPLLQVDLEGNVSIRGSSNIRVLINNKPSTIVAASIADALKMLPADMIKSVEVITSPSAKYDAEGSGGIINIITKKNDLEGYYLNLNTGVGLRGSNLGLNGSYRRGRFGLTLGGFGRAFYNKAETDITQATTLNDMVNLTKQFSDASDNGIFGRYNLGFDYDLDKTQFLSGGIRYGVRRFSRDQLQTTEIYRNDELFSTNLRDINSLRYSGTIDLNLDYLKSFKPQQELSISTLYSRTNENSNFVSDNLDANQSFLNSLKNLDDNLNEEITLQADFITPFGDNQIFEVGAKGILRMVNSDYSYLFAETPNSFTQDFNRPAGTLDYSQNVAAAYTSYTYSTPSKYTFKAGLRWERTAIEATQDNENIQIPDYSNLVPSINASKKLGGLTTLKLGYNRRIQRPWLRQLNPNVNIQNSQNIEVGNPNLRPELTDNIELALSTMVKKTYLNISVFGRLTDNAINQIRFPIDSIPGAILSTYENIGREQAIGMNLFANINISDKWSVNGGVDIDYARLNGQVTGLDGTSITAENSGFNYGGRLMSQLKLDGGWSMQAFTFMRGRRVELQGNRGGFGMYALGVNKDFKNDRGSYGIALENFASRGWNVRSELDAVAFSQVSNMYLLNRSVKINFTYKFGQMDFRNTRKTRSVRNDDLMGDGGGDMQGGGMQGGNESAAPARNNRAARRNNQAAKPATSGTSTPMPEGKALDFSGTWKGVAQGPMGEMEQTFVFSIDGEQLTGTIETRMGKQDIKNGKVEGGQFSFEVTFRNFNISYNGVVLEENKLMLKNERMEMTLDRVQ